MRQIQKCEYVIAYASRALTPAESNYAPTEGECLALVWATRKFRQFVHGQHFTVRTDHVALKWLSAARFENSKLERWHRRKPGFGTSPV
jgi:putative transposase